MTASVSAQHLGKKFLVARSDGPRSAYGYRTLRDDLTRLATAPWRLLSGKRDKKPAFQDFWALDDVNFEINRGEVVGIIGRNGAGKSTLLKILSRITKPTNGQVLLRGRVGSLLEVGTGFHPELTGRENIYLNGAILGMRRGEIQRKFDQIVEFAEIGPFLDTPVKRYSSGMYVRLAFAVAGHLEPEILIVDEVLAVGDMAFQRKCLGRMREVGTQGSTILFVRHTTPAVESLCTRPLLLDKGKVVHDGGVRELISEYHRRVLETQGETETDLEKIDGPQRIRKVFRSCSLLDEQGQPTNFLSLGSQFHLRVGLRSTTNFDFPTITIGIDDNLGQRVLTLQTPLSQPLIEQLRGGAVVECKVPQFPLAPGDYWVKLGLYVIPDEVDAIERVFRFTVAEAEVFGTGRGFHAGLCIAPSAWTFQETNVPTS